jgi:hypothetical protein
VFKWSLLCMVLFVIFVSLWLNTGEKGSGGYALFVVLGTLASLTGSIVFISLT